MPVSEIFALFLSYISDHLNYKITPETYDEIDKLNRHMDYACKPEGVLSGIKKYIPEYSKFSEADLVIGTEKIVIATIHKAKGLEFDNVIIPGCTDSNYPNYFSTLEGEGKIKEDARLFYVAMTRAKKRLYITAHSQITITTASGPWVRPQFISRFLKPMTAFFTDDKTGS